jgi:hypothetical protein
MNPTNRETIDCSPLVRIDQDTRIIDYICR